MYLYSVVHYSILYSIALVLPDTCTSITTLQYAHIVYNNVLYCILLVKCVTVSLSLVHMSRAEEYYNHFVCVSIY